MKKFKILTLGLVAVSCLAGCNQNNDVSQEDTSITQEDIDKLNRLELGAYLLTAKEDTTVTKNTSNGSTLQKVEKGHMTYPFYVVELRDNSARVTVPGHPVPDKMWLCVDDFEEITAFKAKKEVKLIVEEVEEDNRKKEIKIAAGTIIPVSSVMIANSPDSYTTSNPKTLYFRIEDDKSNPLYKKFGNFNLSDFEIIKRPFKVSKKEVEKFIKTYDAARKDNPDLVPLYESV